jgi:hypothetical protein
MSIFTASAFIFLTLYIAILQYITISPIHCIGYIALLKKTLPSHFWCNALLCRYYPH